MFHKVNQSSFFIQSTLEPINFDVACGDYLNSSPKLFSFLKALLACFACF